MQKHRARLVQRPDHPHSCHDPNALVVRRSAHRMHHATFFRSDADQRADHFGFAHSSYGLPDTTGTEDSIYSSWTQLTLSNATPGGDYAASITIGVQIT